jgi:hypothetical protein
VVKQYDDEAHYRKDKGRHKYAAGGARNMMTWINVSPDE